MSNSTATATPETAARDGYLELNAVDVTGTTHVVARDVQRSLPAGAVAKALASRMSLPENVPWALRNDATSAFLEDDKPLGEQLDSGEKASVTVVPKTHLGAGPG